MQCPKCQYIRTITDQHVMEGVCPSCGIAYAKWKGTAADKSTPQSDKNHNNEEVETYSFAQKLWNTLTYIPEKVDAPTFWGRCVLLAIFVVWGLSFI